MSPVAALAPTRQLVETPVVQDSASRAAAEVRAPFDAARAAFAAAPAPTFEERRARLDTLLELLRSGQAAIEEAIDADFGGRSVHETRAGEVFVSVEGVRYARAHLRAWMRPSSRSVSLAFQPASARVVYQPKGVVGIISPWNYPLLLAVSPLAQALAAGNRVLLKPSELTPRFSELFRRLVAERFPADLVAVLTGGPEVGDAFSRLPFDHLVFTGSTHVGRLVMKAAAENLVPVTLELGGKSPAIVHESFDLTRAATRIAAGKWFNAGQTCIAPDYLLAPRGSVDALVAALAKATRTMYPTVRDNPDYTSIVSPRHFARLQGLVDEAVAKGARKIELLPEGEAIPESAHRLPPTLLLGVTDEMKVMQEEIFGPVLPIVPVESVDAALRYVNARPRPLALYYFDDDGARVKQVLAGSWSGGVTVNDTLYHCPTDDLPFGGIGPSGMGAYHGVEGFRTFSHAKGVFSQPRLNGMFLLSPPYGARVERLLKFLIG
jgi:coniferyl-aldehyde dehydrogenase